MKFTRINEYRYFLILLSLCVICTSWIGAQTNTSNSTNSTPLGTVAKTAPATANNNPVLEKQVYITFGLDRLPFLQTEVFGNPIWKHAAFLIYIVLAFYISKLIDWIFHAWLKKLAAKTSTEMDDLLLTVIHGPIKIIAFVILLHIGLDLFSWPVRLEKYLSIALKLLVAGSLTYVVLRILDLLINYWKFRMAPDTDRAFKEHLLPILTKGSKVFVIIVASLLTSQNLGVNITSLIASLSIGGLALGLAAQDTLGNLFGAIVVFFDKPFHIGDRIQLDGGVDGTVESIGLRSTRVRNLEGHLITVPNKTMGNATITNVARRQNIKTEMNFGLTYDTGIDKLRRALVILKEVYGQHPMTHDLLVSFNKFADSSLNVLVVHWWKNTDYAAYMAGIQELNLIVKKRFDEEGINFAFPSRTVYVKQDSDWKFRQH